MLNAILSPHFDDAVLSCWHLLEGPAESTVVNVFTATPPVGTPLPWWDRVTGATDPAQRMRERREEDATALALIGSPAVALGLLDVQYRRDELSVHDLVKCITDQMEPETVLHAPGAFNSHPDHVLVRDAALELARTGRPVVLYADLPHANARGWPAWLSGEPSAQGREIGAEWERVLCEAGLVTANLVRQVHSLDGPTRSRKLQVLAAYQTQRAGLDRYTFAPLDDPRALAWEVTWEVTPSAVRGLRELTGETLVADAAGQPLDNRV